MTGSDDDSPEMSSKREDMRLSYHDGVTRRKWLRGWLCMRQLNFMGLLIAPASIDVFSVLGNFHQVFRSRKF